MKTQTRKKPTQQMIANAKAGDEMTSWCAPESIEGIEEYSLEIKSARITGRGGCSWEAWLYKNDEPILWVENDGNGGCNSYHAIPGFYDGTPKWRNDHTDFINAAKKAYPHINYEHDDILVSFLDLVANDLV
jgi:hypothetical protein